MKRFEYLVSIGFGINIGLLNDMGKEGWELVNAIKTGNNGEINYFFKRELKKIPKKGKTEDQ